MHDSSTHRNVEALRTIVDEIEMHEVAGLKADDNVLTLRADSELRDGVGRRGNLEDDGGEVFLLESARCCRPSCTTTHRNTALLCPAEQSPHVPERPSDPLAAILALLVHDGA